MSAKILNRVRMSVSGTPGTGTITLGSAQSGFQAFSAAGANTGDSTSYLIEDGTNWEIGVGSLASGTTFSRDTVVQSSAGGTTKISVTSAAILSATMLAQDAGDGGGTDVGGPTVVQFASGVATSAAQPTITFGAAPTQGNILVAMTFNEANDYAAASGWTKLASGTSNTWYGAVYYKVAGAGESATQNPIPSGASSDWGIGIWEVNGQSVFTPFIGHGVSVLTGAPASGNISYTDLIPSFPNTLYLAALIPDGLTTVWTDVGGVEVVDANVTTGSGPYPCFGHSGAAKQIYSMSAMQNASVSYKQAYAILVA